MSSPVREVSFQRANASRPAVVLGVRYNDRDGLVALGATLVAYGVAEAAHGYGFLAVFVAALALRETERDHEFHEVMHDFAEQVERLLMMLVLVLLGGAVGTLFMGEPFTARIARPAAPTASSPEAHRRFSVWPGTVSGSPASSNAIRATLRLSSPAWLAQPK